MPDLKRKGFPAETKDENGEMATAAPYPQAPPIYIYICSFSLFHSMKVINICMLFSLQLIFGCLFYVRVNYMYIYVHIPVLPAPFGSPYHVAPAGDQPEEETVEV